MKTTTIRRKKAKRTLGAFLGTLAFLGTFAFGGLGGLGVATEPRIPERVAKDPDKFAALLVGVSEYECEKIQPLNASDDVRKLRDALIKIGCPSEKIYTLLSDGRSYERPTRAKIMAALEAILAESGPDSTVCLVFSGHGFETERGAMFCPEDVEYNGTTVDVDTAISLEEIAARLQKDDAKYKFLIVDSCREYCKSTLDLSNREQAAFSAADANGFAFLHSCGAGEYSYESEEAKGGIFTLALAEGVEGAADSNGDGGVSFHEVAAYASARTRDMARKQFNKSQKPVVRGSVGDVLLKTPTVKFEKANSRTPAARTTQFLPPCYGELKVFLVAGDEYYPRAEQRSLPLATNDVEALRTLFLEIGAKEENIVALRTTRNAAGEIDKNLQPTKKNIEDRYKKFLDDVKPNDLVWTIILGHGRELLGHGCEWKVNRSESAFLPVDFSNNDAYATAVSLDSMYAQLRSRKAKLGIFISDICRVVTEATASLSNATPSSEIKSVCPTVWLHSASYGAKAYEGGWGEAKDVEHSFLVESLLYALDPFKSRADTNEDGELELSELQHYVSERTAESARTYYTEDQTPRVYTFEAAPTAKVLTNLGGIPLDERARANKAFEKAKKLCREKNYEAAWDALALALQIRPDKEEWQYMAYVLCELLDRRREKAPFETGTPKIATDSPERAFAVCVDFSKGSAERLAEAYEKLGVPKKNVVALTPDAKDVRARSTQENFKSALAELAKRSRPGDLIFLSITDDGGRVEESELRRALETLDGRDVCYLSLGGPVLNFTNEIKNVGNIAQLVGSINGTWELLATEADIPELLRMDFEGKKREEIRCDAIPLFFIEGLAASGDLGKDGAISAFELAGRLADRSKIAVAQDWEKLKLNKFSFQFSGCDFPLVKIEREETREETLATR